MTSLEQDLAVVDPVVVHELDPRCGQQVEEGHLCHLWSAIGIARARSSPRLISRGFGVSNCAVSGRMAESSTLRKKRVPAAPSLGSARLFQLPSAVRKWVTPRGGSGPALEADQRPGAGSCCPSCPR